MQNITDLRQLDFPSQSSSHATLSIFEEGLVPFAIKRVFTIKATKPCERGFHAHKKCSQLLVVLEGQCKVTCDDGKTRESYILNDATKGLLIPPTLWAEQEYEANTILMVLTDRVYEEEDYIRNYEEFLEYRKSL